MVVGFHAVNYATASTTASATSGSTTLSFSSASTATIAIGTLLFDVTATNAIAVGTYVTAVGSTSITISQPTAAAVGNGDHFAFCTSTDGEGIIVDSNVDTAYGGRTAVYNNLCFDNGNAGVMVTRSNHCDVYFNTCYHNANHYRLGQFGSAGDIYISGSSTDNRIYNNILSVVSGNTMAKDDGTSNTWSTNLCFGGLGTPPGSGNITTDPKFVNPTTNFATMNFKLQNTSPAINAANGTFTRSTDITGAAAPLGGTNDLGAYESA